MPSTMGSPCRLTVPNASIREMSTPAVTPNTTPRPLDTARYEPAIAAKAPASIIPSIAIWNTPARSQIIPPRAASRIGTIALITDSRRAASKS